MWIVITGDIKSRFDTKAEACSFARAVMRYEPNTVVSVVRDTK